jgi:hypothetical protein
VSKELAHSLAATLPGITGLVLHDCKIPLDQVDQLVTAASIHRVQFTDYGFEYLKAAQEMLEPMFQTVPKHRWNVQLRGAPGLSAVGITTLLMPKVTISSAWMLNLLLSTSTLKHLQVMQPTGIICQLSLGVSSLEFYLFACTNMSNMCNSHSSMQSCWSCLIWQTAGSCYPLPGAALHGGGHGYILQLGQA